MNSKKCQLCKIELNASNDSKEHILPNSVGGRKKVSGFICKSCNSKTGETWDAELASQLNWFSLFLGIVRERGVPPSMVVNTSVGELNLHHDGTQSLIKPVYEVTESDGVATLRIQARNEREVQQLIQRAKSQYPKLNIEEAMGKMQIVDDYTQRIVHTSFEFGGEKCGRSQVKSCMALASTRGIDIEECVPADSYLNQGGPANFGYFFDSDLVLNRPADSIFHCVAVTGNTESKMLLGYVEYFSFQRVVVCLSDTYEGDSFEAVYAIDPRSGTELELKVELFFSKEDIAAIYNYERSSEDGMHSAMNEVMRIGYQASVKRQEDKAFDDAYSHALAECGYKESDALTEEQAGKLSRLMAEKLTPYLLQRLNQNRN